MPRDQYRIAHFGDLHLEAVDEEYDWVLRMVDHARTEGAAHMLFTGDIVDCAQVEVIESLLDDLHDRGLGPEHVSFVPGNHDVYPLGWPPGPKGIWETVTRQSQSKWEQLLRLSKRQHGRAGGQLLGDGVPWVKRLAPGVVLVGMDSTRSGTKDPRHWAEGQLDWGAVDTIAEYLGASADMPHRIVAMHHYPLNDFESASEVFPMKFAEPDAATARNWLRWMGATSVLCGHIHDARERQIAGKIRVFSTDSTIYEFADGRTGRAFRLLSFGPGRRVSSRIIEVNEDE